MSSKLVTGYSSDGRRELEHFGRVVCGLSEETVKRVLDTNPNDPWEALQEEAELDVVFGKGKEKRVLTAQTQSESIANLSSALVVAQGKAGPVARTSKNQFHKYNYASMEDVIIGARAALNEADLALITTSWTENGGKLYVSYRLIHGASAEWLEFTTETPVVIESGEKGKRKPADKAEATALTYNLGYFLRGLLLLPRVEKDHAVLDDDEPDKRDDESALPSPRLRVDDVRKQLGWSADGVLMAAQRAGVKKRTSKTWTQQDADAIIAKIREIEKTNVDDDSNSSEDTLRARFNALAEPKHRKDVFDSWLAFESLAPISQKDAAAKGGEFLEWAVAILGEDKRDKNTWTIADCCKLTDSMA